MSTVNPVQTFFYMIGASWSAANEIPKARPPKWHRHFGNIRNSGSIYKVFANTPENIMDYINFDIHKSCANIQLVHLGVLSAMLCKLAFKMATGKTRAKNVRAD